jgi:hypothetical protein
MDSWSRKIEEKDVRTDSGLRIFKPQVFQAPLDSADDISAVRHALATDGIVLVENALQSDAIKMGLASLENDLRRATAGYLMKEVARQLPDGHVTQADLSRALSAVTGSVSHVPPAEQGPIDGVLNEHRLPLTTCAQLRRVNPGVRRIFSQIYGVEDDEAMVQTPDSARVILHRHLASRSSTSCMGMSPQQIMHRKLNGTFQPPYRNDSYQGYGDELRRRLGERAGVKFGIMGLINYVTAPCGELKKNQTVSVGPCFVVIPGAKRESMRRVHKLPELPTTNMVRRQATRRMQVLADEEIDENINSFACVLAPAGSLILWRRDLPVAFNLGDPAAAGPDAGICAYASQQVSWIPRHAQSPNERRSSLRLFETKSTSTHLYEMPAPSRPKLRRKKRSWRIKKRKRKESESDDEYNDIPEEHCCLLLVQKQSL